LPGDCFPAIDGVISNCNYTMQHSNNLPRVQQDRRLRVAYLTMRDPNDLRSWSGTIFRMARALENHCEVVRVGPLEPFSLKLGKVIHHAIRLATGRNYLYTHTARVCKGAASRAQRKLADKTFDVIFAPAGCGIVAHLETKLPIVYLSDTTFHLMVDYYSDFSNLSESQRSTADQLERSGIVKAQQSVFPSSWAAQSAVEDYGADPSRVHVVPFGANLQNPPSTQEVLQERPTGCCRLLFVGVDWHRKGGDIAFETLLQLERSGIPAELTVVGCTPPEHVAHPRLHVFPFLDKNDPHQRAQLDDLYRQATFFILPTRAECFGIAMCEAGAYGLPVLSTKTGGVPEIVRHGLNGFLLPLEARGDQYAAKISQIHASPQSYRTLRASSREEFEKRLNWDAWGTRMNEILWTAVAQASRN
jgi:glycosyltransferase involved in cell wall biosynthesis